MRIDKYLVENKLITSRTKAAELITNGFIMVNGKIIYKPSHDVNSSDAISIKPHDEYVSRGAYKLLGAKDAFKLNFNGVIACDLGASTGGFCEVLLNGGANKVYAVDVGSGQLADKIKNNPKVINLEKTDIRALQKNNVADVNFVTGDLSFISLKLILPKIKELWSAKIPCVLLIKPQFECGMKLAKKFNGIITDPKIHESIVKDICQFARELGFNVTATIPSPIKGGDGNMEFLLKLN